MTDAERAKDAMPLHCDCGQGFTAAGPVVCSVHERIAAALAAAERRGMERAAKAGDRLVDMIEAQGKVLAAYRLHARRPPEQAFDTLAELDGALREWAAIRAAAKEGA